jgi:hypothetical protein
MKYLGIAIIVLSLVVGIAPQFLDCQSQGKALTLANGKTVPMKCHWTAIASIGLAVPLAATGGFSAFSKRKETRRTLSILGIIMGAFVILMPTTLIGVCASGDMLCNSVMKPLLILGGTLIIILSGIMFIPTLRKGPEPEA